MQFLKDAGAGLAIFGSPVVAILIAVWMEYEFVRWASQP